MTLKEFIDALNAKFEKDGYKFTTMAGPKYVRVVKNSRGQESVFCFVDYAGNIYKSAGWKSPVKQVRSTLATVDIDKVDAYGGWLYAGR